MNEIAVAPKIIGVPSPGIKVKPREYMGRGGKSPSSGSKKLQRLLRTRDDKGIEKMIQGRIYD